MLEYLRLDPSTSFITINPQTPDVQLTALEDFRAKNPTWKLLTEMAVKTPEVSAVIGQFKAQLCNTLPAQWREVGVTGDFLVGVLEYLMVYGFVPFRIAADEASDTKRLVPVLMRHEAVQWSAGMYQKVEASPFPEIEIKNDNAQAHGSLRHVEQYYVYFYRPTAARAQVLSPMMAAVAAYRDLCELRLYNDTVRTRNATRTLIVNRGAAPARPTDSFNETNKPDLFGESIRSSAQKIAVSTTELEIEQDTKQVSFVMRAVKAQMTQAEASDRQFEHVLVMPPLCSTEVYQPSTVELDEGRCVEQFHHALVLAFELPHGFFQDQNNSYARHQNRRERKTPSAQPQGGQFEVIANNTSSVKPDLEECMGIIVALCGQKEYQKRIAHAIREQKSQAKARNKYQGYGVAFAVQSVLPLPPPIPVQAKPLAPFQGLLDMYREGLIEHKDFKSRFYEETGMALAPPQVEKNATTEDSATKPRAGQDAAEKSSATKPRKDGAAVPRAGQDAAEKSSATKPRKDSTAEPRAGQDAAEKSSATKPRKDGAAVPRNVQDAAGKSNAKTIETEKTKSKDNPKSTKHRGRTRSRQKSSSSSSSSSLSSSSSSSSSSSQRPRKRHAHDRREKHRATQDDRR